MLNEVRCRFLAVILGALFVGVAALSVRGTAVTWDEPFHLGAGVSYLQTGDPRLNWDHPPLARILGSLPALFLPIKDVTAAGAEAWRTADVLGFAQGSVQEFDQMILPWGRLCMLVASVLLAWVIYSWGSQLFGPRVALILLVLFLACPPLLANAPIIATDSLLTALFTAAIYGWWRYLRTGSRLILGATGLAVGCAFITKITAALLVPVFGIIALGALFTAAEDTPKNRSLRLRRIVGGGLSIGVVVWLVINISYLFEGTFIYPADYVARARTLNPYFESSAEFLVGFWPAWLPVPLPFYFANSILKLSNHLGAGHFSYFLGEASNGGWRNFFALLLLIKLPLGMLALSGGGLLVALAHLPRRHFDLLCLVTPIVSLLAIASLGNLQIGLRHVLPILPFMILLCGYAIDAARGTFRRALALCLTLSALWSTHSIFPHYLMYSNFLAGGPEEGWRISIEGDDWGQGGAELARWLNRYNVKELHYGGFGWSWLPLSRSGITTRAIPCDDPPGLVAVHLGHLLKVTDLAKVRCYDWMRLRKPDHKIGYSIFIYNTQRIPRPSPPADITLFREALTTQLGGNPAAAVPLYEQYLRSTPDYYQAQFNLGCALKDLGRCSEAIEPFKKTLELWPGYTEAHLHLAHCYASVNRADHAQRHTQFYNNQSARP
jgi:4-amino-4-deoxy-L-arabinose transferase-like glycosyltransferase